MSMGGPYVCPSCDAGNPPGADRGAAFGAPPPVSMLACAEAPGPYRHPLSAELAGGIPSGSQAEIAAAAQRLGISELGVRRRLARGWPLEKALSAPGCPGQGAGRARGMRLTAKADRRERARHAAIVLLCDVVDRGVMSDRAQTLIHNRLGELGAEELA